MKKQGEIIMEQTCSKRQLFAVLIFGFVIAAFGGWLYEEACVYLIYHKIYNRGMLHLTLCPIYGFGAWILYLLLHKVRNSVLFFLLSTAIASAFEYGCALLLEHFLHRSYWTYSGWPLSVHDRISLVSSLIFGLLAVLFAKGILPKLTSAVKRGNATKSAVAAGCILSVIITDFLIVLCGMD